MGSTVQSMRDEFLYNRVKSEKSLSFGLAVTYAFATLLTIAFGIGILVLGKGLKALLADITLGAGVVFPAIMHWHQYKSYAKALEEIGDDPTGIDTCRTYSPETAQIIAGSRRTKSELRQLWIAYGIMALPMLLFGVMFLLFLIYEPMEPLFIIAGGVMWIGGVLLSVLAVKAFREWLMARRLEKLEG